MEIQCQTCKTGRMTASSIHKFGGFLRLVGWLFAIPSILGLCIAVLFAIGGISGATMAQDSGVATASFAGTILMTLFVAGSSLVGGIIGWVLISKKKVFKCSTCGFILDRA